MLLSLKSIKGAPEAALDAAMGNLVSQKPGAKSDHAYVPRTILSYSKLQSLMGMRNINLIWSKFMFTWEHACKM